MLDDVFDDEGVRRAFEVSLGMSAKAFGGNLAPRRWSFERRRYGLRRVEVCPLGFYSAICTSEAEFEELRRFIDGAQGSGAAMVRINVNPLERRADEIARHAIARGYRLVPNQTHVLPIETSIEAMRRNYHATKRAQAQRAVKPRSTIVVASEGEQLDDYFSVYAASLARWGRDGLVYPRPLFSALLACSSVRIWMNYVEGRLACAMVVLYCRNYALYWQGVSRIDNDQKPAYPMVKLMDAVLQDLVLSGIPCINLGASEGLPNVARFKEEFGARPVSYPGLVYESSLWRSLARARELWRRARSVLPGATHG